MDVTHARSAGVLLHPTSLPGRFASGDLGPGADAFLDWVAAAGLGLWQVLPLAPTSDGSPYNSPSAFALNPLLLSPERLVEDGLLDPTALADLPPAGSDRADLESVRAVRLQLLGASWQCRRRAPAALLRDFDAFRDHAAQRCWLDDWTLFAALARRHGDCWWRDWPEPLRRREPGALAGARRELGDDIAFEAWLQFLFARQWARLRREAARRGIRLFGDIPIYVSRGAADVWAHPDVFDLDPDGEPAAVAGVPPDYFSDTGQLWGNPLYRWDRLAADGYRWWLDRIRHHLGLVDLLRIDHFRAFATYWEIPAGASTAVEGRWRPGPGLDFFDRLRLAMGPLPLVAEDLGQITPDVVELLERADLPGMRVLQFGFALPDSIHHPSRVPERCVVFTGTHDNDTTRGWFAGLPDWHRQRVVDFTGGDGSSIHWDLIEAAFATRAMMAVVPMQDFLGLGSEARMNHPSTTTGNWGWRLPAGAAAPELAERVRRMVASSRRGGDGPTQSAASSSARG
jgi:4-alpha-glucanotransferase